ncbi:MAG: hypothetical protein AAF614_40330 [Chloroflexota bacterium]
MILSRLRTLESWSIRRWWLVAAVFMVCWYGLAIGLKQTAVIQDQRIFWLQDDMMISMRYAHNFAAGHGLTWNAGGERVEGFSNFAWVMVMTTVHLLPISPTMTSFVILFLNILLALWVLWLVARLIKRLRPDATWEVPAVLLTLTVIVEMARWTTIGLENTLQTAVFLWLLLQFLPTSNQQPLPTFTLARHFFLAGLLGILRIDGLLLIGVLTLVALWLHSNKKQVLVLSLLSLVLPLLLLLFRLTYYGYPLPNTYYLKLAGWDQRWWPGLLYAVRFLRNYGFVWLLAARGSWRSRDQQVQALWLIGLPFLAYGIYTGGDDFGGFRFFSAWIPILLVLAFLAPRWLGWEKRPFLHLTTLTTLILLVGLLNGYPFWQPSDATATEKRLIQAGLTLNKIATPTTVIGHFWAGMLPYFADRPAVDLLGKNDAYIARLPSRPDGTKPGHNKFDFTYSLGTLQPDLIVGILHPSQIDTPEKLSRYTAGDDAYAGEIFHHSMFQQNYAPNLLFIGDATIYIRADSPTRSQLMQGDCLQVEEAYFQALGFETVCVMQ